jgi:ATP-dependent DNA ligase
MRPALAYDGNVLRTHLIEPCLPSPAKKPPSGPGWLHEIKHDGFRLMARQLIRIAEKLGARAHSVHEALPAIPQA